MKKLLKVKPFVDNDGNRVIKLVYTNSVKIIPFSEETFFKYRRELDKEKLKNKKVIKNVKSKTNVKDIDINIDRFADYIINNHDVIVRRIEIVITAIGLAWLIKYMHNGMEDIPNHVIIDDGIETPVTYDVSEYYMNLYEENIKSK